MEADGLSKEEIISKYTEMVTPFFRYIPWLESKAGEEVSTTYKGEGIAENSVSFPVYDSTLLSFVKELEKAPFIDRNFPYVYSFYRMKTVEDEYRVIRYVTVMEISALFGILSRYVIKGRTKGAIWSEGVRNQIYLKVLRRLQEVLEIKYGQGKHE